MLIGMPVYEGVDLLDVTGPYEMFGWADLEVRLFAEAPGLVASRSGLSIQVTAGFDNAPAFDVLWVPGGDPNALARLMGDPKRVYLDFLLKQSAHARYVSSVCEGALLLAAAGLLDGYEATTHWAFIPCFAERFPKVRIILDHMARPVLEDGPPYAAATSLFDLARYPNVFLKITPLNVMPEHWGKASPETFFGKLMETFGANRIAWGSNFPATADTLEEKTHG